jgi:hypothetical protein
MRLLCQKVLLFAALSMVACHDTSGPGELRQFVLHDVNGRPVPTFLAPTPGETPTIVSGSLILNGAGQAVILEHRIEWDGAEHDYTSNYIYKITGSTIVFDRATPCPPNALCAAPPKGTVTAFGVAVDWVPSNPGFMVFNYDAIPRD